MGIPRRKGHPAALPLSLLASVALLLGGWAGAQASAKPAAGRRALTRSQTHTLLALVAKARADADASRAGAVLSALSEFTSDVQSLRASGSIDRATANKLLLGARISESQTAAQLQARPASTTADTTGTVIPSTPAHGAHRSQATTPIAPPTATPTPGSATPPSPGDQPATPQTIAGAIASWWEEATAGLDHGHGWHHGHERLDTDQPDNDQPDTDQPDTDQPGTHQPAPGHSGYSQYGDGE
jgi:hypothetical protein